MFHSFDLKLVPAEQRKLIWDALIDYLVEIGNLAATLNIHHVHHRGTEISQYVSTIDEMSVDDVMSCRSRKPIERARVEEMFTVYRDLLQFGKQGATIGFIGMFRPTANGEEIAEVDWHEAKITVNQDLSLIHI